MLIDTAEHVDACLLPTVNCPPKLDYIVKRLLAKLNATNPLMPDGSGRRLRLHLGDKPGLHVAIVSRAKTRFTEACLLGMNTTQSPLMRSASWTAMS